MQMKTTTTGWNETPGSVSLGSAYKPAGADGIAAGTMVRIHQTFKPATYQVHVVTTDAAKTITSMSFAKSERAAWKLAASAGYTETVKPCIRNKR